MTDTPEARTPNVVDVHVGGRVRMRRKMLGVSQETLADALKLTFQQVQKLYVVRSFETAGLRI